MSIPMRLGELGSRVKSMFHTNVAKSVFWVVFATGGQQMIRLIGNLILTRLLFPELFGVMAILHAVLVAVGLLSDIGLRESVINSDRVDDPKFMRTAWTIQIIRTAVLGAVVAICAFPFAKIYDEPMLVTVLLIASVTSVLGGFKSIAPILYDKRMEVKRQMIVDMGIQVVGLTVAITWAYFSPTIWSLIVSYAVTIVLDVATSYFLFKGHFSKLAWDRPSVSQILHYGKWIFVSSAISVVVLQGDRLIMGVFMSMGDLGKYSVAATWAAIITMLSGALSGRVLHPYFRQAIENHNDFTKIHKVRNILNTLYVGGCVFFAFIGSWLIQFLYDERYHDAGWMTQILALGQVGRALTGTLQPFILANGDSFSQMKFSASSAFILVFLIVIGGSVAGAEGVIIAYACSGLLAHPVMVMYASKHGYRCIGTDSGFIFMAIALSFLLWTLSGAPILDVIANLEVELPD